ncbi:type II toxin-antitoxin system HicB family antitoxin [Acetomicrobium hydrogeniformans]|uniref:type II toxin-antitoxin system HicB family antitoxin n=1 Tax=Acetomicrobium hydrogeniformans TaxID=649746 RepID=UPI0023538B03|nr:type II toxin-antitoxin system HicB family antitoxin [Acetomicrobium hydrogeniformans]
MKQKFIYWQDDNLWIGYFEEFPDYWTQGETLEELKENLRDLWWDLASENIPMKKATGSKSVSPTIFIGSSEASIFPDFRLIA